MGHNPYFTTCITFSSARESYNSGVVASIHKGSCKHLQVMHLLHTLMFFTAYYDIDIMAEYIPGVPQIISQEICYCISV